MALLAFFVSLIVAAEQASARAEEVVRFATFNASLNRETEGGLVADLSNGDNAQARNVAEVIQRVRPDVLLLNEFDYDATGRAPGLFQDNYLARPQNGAEAITYPFRFTAAVNTGVATGFDLDGNGRVEDRAGSRGYGNDCQGFGAFPGQYGMVIYSRFPIADAEVRDFGGVRWKDQPGALLPLKTDGSPWYSRDALEVLRLSSKSHWDVPIRVGDVTIHVLASHPTPPAFDGPVDRNRRRNHDEIRIWADYLTGGPGAAYLSADGRTLDPTARFVVMGDLNADPVDGGSVPGAIAQLLDHSLVNSAIVPRSEGAAEASRVQGGANRDQRGPAACDTADFADRSVGNLRVDYVLPSKTLDVRAAGVFWPAADDPLARLVVMEPHVATSDHRMVWVDVVLPKINR